MRLFRRVLFLEFIPFLIVGLFFFTLIIFLADVFSNLWRYLNEEIPFSRAIMVSLLYAPTAMTYAMPIGAMFAAAFALGSIGARNELIAIFGSGVLLFRFVRPMLVFSLFLSIGAFLLEDRFAIPFIRRRTALSKELLNIEDVRDKSGAIAITNKGRIIYFADYYNDQEMLLVGLTIIRLDNKGQFKMRIDASSAKWDSDRKNWLLVDCKIYSEEKNGDIARKRLSEYQTNWVNEVPETFRLDTRELKEMNARDAYLWIETQKRAGLPYRKHQAEYYQRFTTAFTPFLVVFFAGALAGRFKRNILLMSLLVSLSLSSLWYVIRVVFSLLSESGLILPLTGAILPYVAFLIIGVYLFRIART